MIVPRPYTLDSDMRSWVSEGILASFNGQNKYQCSSRGEVQGPYQFAVLGRTRLYVVVTFTLWEVRCRRAMHSD